MNIYITLDYELFLNDITGDVEHCLVKPTEEFLRITDKYGVKATFFVDAAYLWRLNELKKEYPQLSSDYLLVTNQIRSICSANHKIALHLHPQWFYSKYDGLRWILDFEHYKLSDMPVEKADYFFVNCLKLLKDIAGVNVDSFRAGGYSIQGYKSFPKILKSNGITKDSSVLFGMKNLSKLHYYDYTSLSSSQIYEFEDNILVPVETKGSHITEYPISTAQIPFLRYCYTKLLNRKIQNNDNWGNGGDLPMNRRTGFIMNFFKKFRFNVPAYASIDYQSFSFTDYVIRKQQKQSADLVIMGHPKNFSPASLNYLERLMGQKDHIFKTL